MNPVRVAVVQAAPVVFDVRRTLAKFQDLAAEAARRGARLAVFPETAVSLCSVRFTQDSRTMPEAQDVEPSFLPQATRREGGMRGLNLLMASLVLGATGQAGRADGPVPAADIRKAVEHSLPYLEKEGVAWMEKHHCLSCHHVPFLLWSHNEARARGFTIDQKKLAGWTDWSLDRSLSQRGLFKLTEKPLAGLPCPALSAATLAKLKPVTEQEFVTQKALLRELGKVLTPDELNQHQAALVKAAAKE